MGVDKFYVYDNDAVSDLAPFSSPFVEVVYWPHPRSQVQCFTHFILASRKRCKYVAFFDADEYVMLGEVAHSPFKRYVKRKLNQGFKQVSFTFVSMFNDGYVKTPQGELPDLYVKRDMKQVLKVGKTVIDIDAGWDGHKGHRALREDPACYVNATMELNPKGLDDNAMLVHYTRRSWEEQVLKQRVGSASDMTNRNARLDLFISEPLKWYMQNENVVEWYGMRDYFRRVMQKEDDGTSVLTWMNGAAVVRQKWHGKYNSANRATTSATSKFRFFLSRTEWKAYYT